LEKQKIYCFYLCNSSKSKKFLKKKYISETVNGSAHSCVILLFKKHNVNEEFIFQTPKNGINIAERQLSEK